MRLRRTPFEREKRFMDSLDLSLIQKALWPLLVLFILLNFTDVLTTLIAAKFGPGFVEFNALGAGLFGYGLSGFMLAYSLKFIPTLPLFYLVALRPGPSKDDFQVRLLKFMALTVLIAADVFLGSIVLGNNLPQLLEHF